jgi:uncharacterized protein
MIIEHIKASDFIVNNWTGGTTTQLAIYPKDADYKLQNFLFRISTATVEVEESTFTKLPGISRKLMILDGEIKIEHQNQHSKILKKFEQDCFEGNWNTKSYGKAIDFNLMTTGTTKGEIESLIIKNKKQIHIDSDFDFYGFYVYTGEIDLIVDQKDIKISQGDFLSLHSIKKNEIEIVSNEFSEIILTKVNFN